MNQTFFVTVGKHVPPVTYIPVSEFVEVHIVTPRVPY